MAGEAKNYALWFFWTMLLRMPLQPRGNIPIAANITFLEDFLRHHGEIIYGGTRWIEDDCSATFSEYIFLFPACLMISHWLTKNAELNSVF